MVSDNPETFADLDGHYLQAFADAMEKEFFEEQATENQNAKNAGTAQNQTPAPQYTTAFYDVHGDSALAAINAANASSSSGCAQSAGCTHSEYSYAYSQRGSVQGTGQQYSASLTAANVTVTVSVNISLPNWVEYKNATGSEQKAWDAIVSKLRAHEEGHVAIDRVGVGEIKSAIQGTSANGSGQSAKQALTRAGANLGSSVQSKFNAALAAIGRRNDAYDLSTNHGLN